MKTVWVPALARAAAIPHEKAATASDLYVWKTKGSRPTRTTDLDFIGTAKVPNASQDTMMHAHPLAWS